MQPFKACKKPDLNNNSISLPASALMTTASIVLDDEINPAEQTSDSCLADKQIVPP